MYEGYAGLIFDMDGTILDTEPTHRQAWNEVLGRYGMRFDEQAMVALNGPWPFYACGAGPGSSSW